jgi:hypothetical protein
MENFTLKNLHIHAGKKLALVQEASSSSGVHQFCILITKSNFQAINNNNTSMCVNDSSIKVKTTQESYLTEFSKAKNSTCEMMNVFRLMEAEGEHTWDRQLC